MPPPSWHRTWLFTAEATPPPPKAIPPLKQGSSPGGGLPAKGGARETEHLAELDIARGNRARSRWELAPRPPALRGPALHRRPARGGGGQQGREARETNRHYARRKSKSKSSFPHILFSWSRLKGLEGKELNEEVLARGLDPRGPIKPSAEGMSLGISWHPSRSPRSHSKDSFALRRKSSHQPHY